MKVTLFPLCKPAFKGMLLVLYIYLLNTAPSALQPYTIERSGRKCTRSNLPTRAPERIKTLLASSLTHEMPKIFNAPPKELRTITGCPVENFKSSLDKFLWTIPDEPPVPGCTARCRILNTIPDQVALRNRDARFGNSGGPPWL